MSLKKRPFRGALLLGLSLSLLVITLVIDEAIFTDVKRRVEPQSQITQNVQEQIDLLDTKMESIADVAIVDLGRLFNRLETDESYPYFIFADQQLVYWSTSRFVPRYGSLSGTYLYRFLDIKSGKYLVRRKVIQSANNQIVEVYGLLPLQSRVAVSDDFQESGLNGAIFGRTSFQIDDQQNLPDENKVLSKEGIFLFSFEGPPKMKVEYPTYQAMIFLFYLLVILSFVWASALWAQRFLGQKKPVIGIGVFAFGLVLARIFMIRYEYPLSLLDLSIFDPAHYAASWWQPSLGDLLLNQLSILAIVGLAYRQIRQNRPISNLWIWSLFLLASVAFAFQIWEFRSLLENSQWSLDTLQDIRLSQEKLASYLVIFVNGFIYFLIAQIALKQIEIQWKRKRQLATLGILVVVSTAFALATKSLWVGAFAMHCIYSWCALALNFPLQVNRVSYNTFLYFFIASFFVALSSTYVLFEHIRKEDYNDKIALATDLLASNDFTAEFLLAEADANIESDILIQTNISSPFAPKEIIRQKIRRAYLGDYFDNYDIDIFLFNGRGRPINDNTSLDYATFQNVYASPTYATDYEDLFFLKTEFPSAISQYYLFSEIRRYNTTVVGYVVIKLDRKQQVSNSILPMLLLDGEARLRPGKFLDYALFDGDVLLSSTGDFNYERDFVIDEQQRPQLANEGIELHGYHHLAVRGASDGQYFVMSSPLYPTRFIMTNFSVVFLFLVFLIIVLFIMSAGFYNYRRKGVSLSAKIQILINFAFFLPLITVSIVVLSLINRTIERNLEDEYLNGTESAGVNLVSLLEDFLTEQNENNLALENRVVEISQFTQRDINLFNRSGRLIATNQRLIFDNQLLSSYINPRVMASLVESNNNKLLFKEYLGELEYEATYYGIRSSADNRLLGILSIPFFEAELQLNRQQTEIFSNILNSFTFIFMIFVALSLMASRILTYPFKFLTQKIKVTTLSQYNEPLEWRADDEIGLMVKEYNRMLVNLEKSKKALALSEKESAWREMAQQVAHEIKNPLTPMKLKLQHLSRVLSAGKDIGESYKKPIESLLHQVETLSDIATSFSSYAKMPVPLSERMDLGKTLKNTVSLFKHDRASIRTNIPRNPVWIEADEKLLGRIFNNLLLNAIQSIPEDRQPELEVELELTSTKARVSVSDNGCGIADDIRDKIFIPKFSTKEEGSGIGLAIAKRGVEHAGGSIWFESEKDKGTTFLLEFPLMD